MGSEKDDDSPGWLVGAVDSSGSVEGGTVDCEVNWDIVVGDVDVVSRR